MKNPSTKLRSLANDISRFIVDSNVQWSKCEKELNRVWAAVYKLEDAADALERVEKPRRKKGK